MNDVKNNILKTPCSYFILWDNDDNVIDCEYISVPPSEIEDIGENWIKSEFLYVKWRGFIVDHLKSDLSQDGKSHGFSRYDFPDSSFLPSKKGMSLFKYIQNILIHFCDNRDYECMYSSDYDEEKEVIYKREPNLQDTSCVDYENATKFLIAARDSFSKVEMISNNLIFQSEYNLTDEQRENISLRLHQTSYFLHILPQDLVLESNINYLTPYAVLEAILNKKPNADIFKELYFIQCEKNMVSVSDFLWQHRHDNRSIENLISVLLNNNLPLSESSQILHWLDNTSYIQYVCEDKKCCSYHLLCVADNLQLMINLSQVSKNTGNKSIIESVTYLADICFHDLQNIRKEFQKNDDYNSTIEYIDQLRDKYFSDRKFVDITNDELLQTNDNHLNPLSIDVRSCKSLATDIKAILDIMELSPDNVYIPAYCLRTDPNMIIEEAEKIEHIGLYSPGFKTSVLFENINLCVADDFIKYYLSATQHKGALSIAVKQQIQSDVRIDILIYNAKVVDGKISALSSILNEIYGFRAISEFTQKYDWKLLVLPEKKQETITENLSLYLSKTEYQKKGESQSNSKSQKK